MRRLSISAAVLLIAWNLSCAVFRPRPAPYPEGLIFPLVATEETDIDGIPTNLAPGRDGKFFAVLREGRVLCVDSETGEVLWTYDAGRPLDGGLSGASGRVFAVSEEGFIHAIDPDGGPAWKASVEGRISTDAVLFQDLFCVGTEDGRLMAFEMSGEGATAWVNEAGSPIVAGPAAFENRLFFFTADGRFHALDPSGRLLWSVDSGGPAVGPLLVNGSWAFYGTEDRFIRGFDLEKRRLRWSMRVGGHVAVRPELRGNTLYVLTTEGVLYSMTARRGHILWWRALPSRSVLGLSLAGDNVFVSCRSPLLRAFNARTGERAGEYKFSEEVVSEALWLDPRIVVPIQGQEDAAGRLMYIERDIRLTLTADKTSPQEPGQEITFSATAVGFHRPQYTFFIRTETGERRIAQVESDRNTWAWFPDREGLYTIEVLATDVRKSLETRMEFEVKRAAEKPKEPKEKKEKMP